MSESLRFCLGLDNKTGLDDVPWSYVLEKNLSSDHFVDSIKFC